MQYTITALDLHFLSKELQELLNAKVVKVYQPEKTDLIFVMHLPGKGKKILRIILPGSIFLTDFKGEVPQEPLHFCMALRKYLNNSRLRQINQLGFERILQFVFSTKDAIFHLYIELFGAGNVIFCTEDDTIKFALITKKWKDRVIRGNMGYEYPKKQYNFLTITKQELSEIIKTSNKDSIVKTIAMDLGLGGVYAEELCYMSGIDKNKKKLTASDTEKLFASIKKLRNAKLNPHELKKDDKVTKVYPIKLHMDNLEKVDSFCLALGNLLTEKVIKSQEEKKHLVKTKELRRVEKVIAKQEEKIKELQETIDKNQKIGEHIFLKYTEIDEILKEINKATKKYSWKEIKAKLKNHKIIKQINEKNKEIVIDI